MAGERIRQNLSKYLLLFHGKVDIGLNVKFVAIECSSFYSNDLMERVFVIQVTLLNFFIVQLGLVSLNMPDDENVVIDKIVK